MNRSNFRHLWVVILSLLTGLFNAPPTLAQKVDPRLKQIFSDWQKRQDRLQSIRYRVGGEHVWVKDSMPSEIVSQLGHTSLPSQDFHGEKNLMLLLDLTSQRHRLEIEENVY